MKLPKLQIPNKPPEIRPISGTTQQHLLIADIVDDLVLTKEGGAAIVLKTTALNFFLLSGKEQEAIIYAYSSILNSLSFPVQIVVRSQKKDVSNYIEYLSEEENKQTDPQLKQLMSRYREFVGNVVKKRNVLEKEFLIVLPFSPFELGLSAKSILKLFSKNTSLPYSKDYVIKKAKTVLYPKRDHLMRQSGRIGVKMQQLKTEELAKLFHGIYHPNSETATQSSKPDNSETKDAN